MCHKKFRDGLLRRTFIILLCLMVVSFSADSQSAAEPVRGLWVIRHTLTSPASIDSMLRFAAAYGFTDLFVQVRGRGDAYYHSHFEPPAEALGSNFDPLADVLVKARQYTLRIHAWINVFYIWSSEQPPKSSAHLFYQHPDWIIYPAQYNPQEPDSNMSGRRNEEGLYLSPLLPEVQTHLLNVVEDILSQYTVDGLHLDYIRFPGYGHEFDPTVRQRFKEKYFIDPIDFKANPSGFAQNFGPTGYDIFFSRWGKFLRDGLSEFVKNMSITVRRRYPAVKISAAVKPDLPRAHWRYYQEWDRWLKEGWLDWAIPMNYTPDRQLFLQRIEAIVGAVDASKVVMGVATYNQPPGQAIEKIRLVDQLRQQNIPLKGVVLFSYDQFVKDKTLQPLYYKMLSNRRTQP